jgi:hypothetical protein
VVLVGWSRDRMMGEGWSSEVSGILEGGLIEKSVLMA